MEPALLWFFIGVAFLILELIVPGIILIFFTFSAWLVSLLAVFGVFEDNLTVQLLIFIGVGVASLFILRKYIKTWFNGKESTVSSGNLDDQEWINKKVVVIEAIPAQGYGRVEYNGTSWKATSNTDIATKSLVTITSKEELCFTVKL